MKDLSMLKPYGIQSEKTTHRIHVDFDGGAVFIYRTEDGIARLPHPILPTKNCEYEINDYYVIVPSWLKPEDKEKRLATSRGIRIPYTSIKNCQMVEFDERFDTKQMTTTQKGAQAVKSVIELFSRGKLPLHLTVLEVRDRKDQILGKDIDIGNVVIQIKHDHHARANGLFLQTHECNPYKMH